MTARSPQFGKRLTLGRFVMISLAGHLLVAAMLGFAPSRPVTVLEPVITVDLLAALPREASAPAPERAPEPKVAAIAPPPPAPKVLPKPVPKPKKIVLPKKAPKATRKPREVDRPPRRVKPEELEYGDALAQLRKELGESEPAEELAKAEPATPSGSASRHDIELQRWAKQVDRHVRARWVTPQEFLDRDLETLVAVDLAADGSLLGQPRVVGASGDAFFDDSAIRAIWRASPLPPPPEAGEWTLLFLPRQQR